VEHPFVNGLTTNTRSCNDQSEHLFGRRGGEEVSVAAVSRALERPRPIPFVDDGARLWLVDPKTPSLGARARRRLVRRPIGPGLATVAALAGLWFGTGLLVGGPTREVAPPPIHTVGGLDYVVRPGDSLWSIASAFDRGADPAPIVLRLREELHGAALRPGTVLRIR
jgi:hypothetical protein